MEAESFIFDLIVTNLPTLVAFAIALVMLRKQRETGLFILGLLLVLLSGLLAMPVGYWLWSNHASFMSGSTLGTVLLISVFGLLQSGGLLCCILAFSRRCRDA